MKAIIIAAGMGSRLGHLTQDKPKCLLPIQNTTLLGNLIRRFRKFDISDIAIVKGYKSELISLDHIKYFINDNYHNNNILHSLMYAKDFMDDDIIISYSDIWLEDQPLHNLIHTSADIAISVDTDWIQAYEGRTDHPISEGEHVFFNENHDVIEIGKHLNPYDKGSYECGEFIGLFKISKKFIKKFIKIFDEIDTKLKKNDPFHKAKEWQKAYITDIMQEFVNRNIQVKCSLHQGQWAEIDTIQDYEKLQKRLTQL